MADHYLPRGTAYGFHSPVINSTTVAVGLTAANVGDTSGTNRSATGALIVVTADAILYTVDGTDPTTVGVPAAVGDRIYLQDSGQVRNFKAVKVTANATLRVTLFR